MRSTTARAFLATGLAAVATVVVCGSVSYAGVRQAGPVKVTGTADLKFKPADITATLDAQGNVTIDFKSEGAPHTIQSDEVPFDSGNVDAGTSKTVTFAAKPGTYAFYCSYHKTSGMTGTLTVKGSAAAPSASAAPSAAATTEAPASASATPTATPTVLVIYAGSESPGADAPGIAGNQELEQLDAERAAQHGAVSGFRFFTMVAIGFLVVLSAGVLFSTRSRRSGA
jgi:plastocyanin